MLKSTGHETAHYAISFCPLLAPCSKAQIPQNSHKVLSLRTLLQQLTCKKVSSNYEFHI